LNTVTVISLVKNLVARYEYMNIKHRYDGGCVKMETYLGIRLLAEKIHLRTKHIFYQCLPLSNIVHGT